MEAISKISGFPEYLPHQQQEFQKIIQKIKKIFERFCALPIETPAVERLETLLKKGGNPKEIYTLGRLAENYDKQKNELGLRFDLTIPLARYVSQHFSKLTFPFRRYQIQPVWRGERAQKGRYRQFYQCDFDIIGSENLSNSYDAEILLIIAEIMEALKIKNYKIRLNNRAILTSILDYFGVEDKNLELVFKLLDKKNKIDSAQFQLELKNYVPATRQKEFQDFFSLSSNKEVIQEIENIIQKIGSIEIKKEYIKFMALYEVLKKSTNNDPFYLDLSIVRGLEYYTGVIFETTLNEYSELGSICSGGRYDNLAKQLGKRKLPGVGFSIGLSRLFDVLYKSEKNIVENKILLAYIMKSPSSNNDNDNDNKKKNENYAEMLLKLDKKMAASKLEIFQELSKIAKKLRNNNIPTEIFMEEKPILTQIQYAEKKNYRWIGFYGEEEIKENIINIKDLQTKKQTVIPLQKMIEFFKNTD